METIIYDTKTGRIIPLEEAQALFHGQTVPRNSLGIVNKKVTEIVTLKNRQGEP